MTRPSVSSCLFLCALAAAALSSTGTEAFVPSSPVVPLIIAKLDAAAELKAAEMAFDLGADGFVGKSDFMTRWHIMSFPT